MKTKTIIQLAVLAGLGYGGYRVYKFFGSGALNPFSNENVAYKGATAALAPLTGDSLSAGGGIFDSFHVLVKKPDGSLDTVLRADLWIHHDWIPWDLSKNAPAGGG